MAVGEGFVLRGAFRTIVYAPFRSFQGDGTVW